jgi:hypothetical protein
VKSAGELGNPHVFHAYITSWVGKWLVVLKNMKVNGKDSSHIWNGK